MTHFQIDRNSSEQELNNAVRTACSEDNKLYDKYCSAFGHKPNYQNRCYVADELNSPLRLNFGGSRSSLIKAVNSLIEMGESLSAGIDKFLAAQNYAGTTEGIREIDLCKLRLKENETLWLDNYNKYKSNVSELCKKYLGENFEVTHVPFEGNFIRITYKDKDSIYLFDRSIEIRYDREDIFDADSKKSLLISLPLTEPFKLESDSAKIYLAAAHILESKEFQSKLSELMSSIESELKTYIHQLNVYHNRLKELSGEK